MGALERGWWEYLRAQWIAIAALLVAVLSFTHAYQNDYRASAVRMNKTLLTGFAVCQGLLFQSQKLKFTRAQFQFNAPTLAARLFPNSTEVESLERLAKQCSTDFMEFHGATGYTPEREARFDKLIARLRLSLEDTRRRNETLDDIIAHLKPEDMK